MMKFSRKIKQGTIVMKLGGGARLLRRKSTTRVKTRQKERRKEGAAHSERRGSQQHGRRKREVSAEKKGSFETYLQGLGAGRETQLRRKGNFGKQKRNTKRS